MDDVTNPVLMHGNHPDLAGACLSTRRFELAAGGAVRAADPRLAAPPVDYRLAFANAARASLILDEHLVVRAANGAYLAVAGRGEKALIGREVCDVMRAWAGPGSDDQLAPVRDSMRRALAAAAPDAPAVEMEFTVERATGAVTWHLATRAFDSGGRRLLVHEIDDVTASRRAEVTALAAVAATARRAVELTQVGRGNGIGGWALHRIGDRLRRTSDDRVVKEALQRALLPDLPEVGGLELAAGYVAASPQAGVGGDWYDVVTAAGRHRPRNAGGTPGRSPVATAVIGDVVGHDLEAAAAMSRVRSMLRAFIWSEPGPAAALSQLDLAATGSGAVALATAVVAEFDYRPPTAESADGTWEITWSNAGHPPPLVVLPDGRAGVLATFAHDLLLGVDPGAALRRDHRRLLPVGSTVVLYTDGLIEDRTMDVDTGVRRLLATLSGTDAAAPAGIVQAVLALGQRGTERHDDMAVLAVRLQRPLDRFPGARFTTAGTGGLRRPPVGPAGPQGV